MSSLSSRVRTTRKTTMLASTQRRREVALNARARKRRADRMYAYRNNLPFVNRKSLDGLSWWSVVPTGNYQADYEVGRRHAMEFWRQCGTNGNFGLDLGQILMEMHSPKRKRSDRHNGLSGIEVGFIRTIGELMACLIGIPALVGSLPKNSTKLKIKKSVFKKKIKTTVDFVGLLVRSGHERERELARS
jgi:hypothetical protein